MKNNLFKETSIIDDLINLSMKNILVNIQKNNKIFINELDYQYTLALELKKESKNIEQVNIYIEFNELNINMGLSMNLDENKINNKKTGNKFWQLDIVIELNERYYIIELKYGYDRSGTGGRLNLSQAVRGKNGFINDIEKIHNLMNKFSNINKGYCILLTMSNEKVYAKKYTNRKIFDDAKWIDIGLYSYYIQEINNT